MYVTVSLSDLQRRLGFFFGGIPQLHMLSQSKHVPLLILGVLQHCLQLQYVYSYRFSALLGHVG